MTWRVMMRVFDAPIARAASTNSRSRNASVAPRTTRAIDPHSRHDSSSVMPSGPPRSTRAEGSEIDGADRHRHREERQRRERDPEVGEAHEQTVEPAAVEARERADHHADARRQHRDPERDLQRDLSTVQHARQRVAAQLVGAEPVAPTTDPRSASSRFWWLGSGAKLAPTKQARNMNTRKPRPIIANG